MKQSDLHNATDTQLLNRYQEGRDQSAFGEIVHRHGPMVWATAWRMTRSKEDSDDVFQATFFSLAKSIGRIRDKEAVAAWLHRTAQSSAMQTLRGNRRWDRKAEQMREQLDMSQDREIEPSVGVVNVELGKIIDEEIVALPEKIRVAIVLCEVEGLSRTEAGKKLGIGRSTVDDHVVKGRRMLRERILRRGISWPIGGLAAYIVTSSKGHSFALTAESICTTAANSTLYAAGKSAAEIGVSSRVIHMAQQVTSAMTKIKLTTVGLVALTIIASLGSLAGLVGSQAGQAHAGTLYIEDFTDTSADNWIPWHAGRGTVDIVDGELVFTPNSRLDMLLYAKDVETQDVSVRIAARATETGGGAGVSVRGDADRPDKSAYAFGVGYNPNYGGSIVTASLSNAEGVDERFFRTTSGNAVLGLPYDVRTEKTMLQLDVIGNRFRGWAWRKGEAMPDEPQFDFTDDTNSDVGVVTLTAVNRVEGGGVGGSQAVFSSIHIANMPIHEIVSEAAGDFDGSGTLDSVDIDLLNEQINVGSNNSLFDLNGDGLVSEDDRQIWVQDLAGTFLGDANLDFTVDSSDLNALALNWQQSVASWAGGDFTGDGLVNAADLNVLALNWQNAANVAAAVPEPSSLLLLSVLFGSSFFLVRNHLAIDN